MPDAAKKPTLTDIEDSIVKADAIVAKGKDHDGALTVLAKGMSDGMGKLLDLLKGRPIPPKAEPDGDEGGEGGEKEPGAEGGEGAEGKEGAEGAEKKPEVDNEDEDGDGEGKPGFEDMRMGKDGTDEYVDVTEYVLALEKKIAAQGATIGKLHKAVKTGNAQIAALTGRMEAFFEVYAANTLPMQKAMLGLQESLLDIPAATHTPGVDGARAAVRHALQDAAKKAADDTGIDVVKLSKGLKSRVLTEDDLRSFKRTGRFVEDEAVNAELVKKVSAL